MNLKDIISASANEAWSLHNLAAIGRKAALNEVVEVAELTHLLENLEARLETLHYQLDTLQYSDVVNAATAIQGGVK